MGAAAGFPNPAVLRNMASMAGGLRPAGGKGQNSPRPKGAQILTDQWKEAFANFKAAFIKMGAQQMGNTQPQEEVASEIVTEDPVEYDENAIPQESSGQAPPSKPKGTIK